MLLSASLLVEKPLEKPGLLTLRSRACTERNVLETTFVRVVGKVRREAVFLHLPGSGVLGMLALMLYSVQTRKQLPL